MEDCIKKSIIWKILSYHFYEKQVLESGEKASILWGSHRFFLEGGGWDPGLL